MRPRPAWNISRGNPTLALLFSAAAACLAMALASTVLSDIVTLHNGQTIKCKIVKEMDDLIKVRTAHRGKIVTTFLNRGAVESITKSPDEENRKLFQGGGVRSPSRAFEPVYYSGVSMGSATGKAPGGARPGTPRGKSTGGKTGKKRGIEGRKERFESGSKERSDRFGKRASSSTKTGTGTTASAETTAPASPSTTGSSGTTSTGGFGTAQSVSASTGSAQP